MTATMTRYAVVGILLLLAGCGAPVGEGAVSAAPRDSHTMSDGRVMDGSVHVHDDSHDHGESEAEEDHGPSAAASMVCNGQVVDDVARITGSDEIVQPRSAWSDPMLTCTFDLDEGALVLSVHDAEDRATGMAHFQTVRTSQEDAQVLTGVYGLGLPAFETDDGLVSFVRDGKTLEVDATGLPEGRLGSEGDLTRTEMAYAVATSVLACWTEHG